MAGKWMVFLLFVLSLLDALMVFLGFVLSLLDVLSCVLAHGMQYGELQAFVPCCKPHEKDWCSS